MACDFSVIVSPLNRIRRREVEVLAAGLSTKVQLPLVRFKFTWIVLRLAMLISNSRPAGWSVNTYKELYKCMDA